MSRPPLKVLLLSDGPAGGGDGCAYLEMLLGLQGRFDVLRGHDADGAAGQDAVLVCASRPPSALQPSDAPVIVLPQWRPEPWEVEAMVEDGAEDVVPMAELNAARLESAVRKAMGRRARLAPTRVPLREALAAVGVGPAWDGSIGLVPPAFMPTIPAEA